MEEDYPKYVRDLDGMLKEIRRWEEEAPLWETAVEEYIYENAVVFAFGRLYRFFNFSGINFGMPKGLDRGVVWKEEEPSTRANLTHISMRF